MFETTNTSITELINFVRKVSYVDSTLDYDGPNRPTYEVVKIKSNVHDISNEEREFDSPGYKTNKTMRLTNDLGTEYKPDDYFIINGVTYSIKITKNRPTFNSCIAESINFVPDEIKTLL